MRVYAISLVSPAEEPAPRALVSAGHYSPEARGTRLRVTFSRLVRRLGVPRAERMLDVKEAILISFGIVASLRWHAPDDGPLPGEAVRCSTRSVPGSTASNMRGRAGPGA